MATGSFTDTPEYKKIRKGAKWGQYDESTLADALQGKGMDATFGVADVYRTRDQALADPLLAGVPDQFRGDLLGAYQQGGDLESYLRGIEGGFTSAITADPNAGNPMSGGMSWQQYQQLFPEQARAYGKSDAYRTAVGTMPSAGNPAAVSDPTPAPEPTPTPDPVTTPAPAPAPAPAPSATPAGMDPGMLEIYQSELDKARNMARQGRTDFSLQDASIAASRLGMPSDIESLRAMVMKDFVSPAGAASGPVAQPQVTATAQPTGTTFQPTGPSAEAAQAVGGVTDAVLRQQQMDTQRELIGSAEEAAAQTREGLPGLRVADPNLDIQFDPATAPVGGPNIATQGYVSDITDPGFTTPQMLATGDVQYDPEYFKYETDLQQIMLDALRQNLMGEGGMDPQTAAQMADLQARQARDEAQTTEDLQRLGVLRGGGDTADVLGELRSGYGRTYSDILSDQAYRQQNDPRLEAALELAQLGSDRYMTGGEMVGRLGGQDTLAARQAQQDAIESQAGMTLESQLMQQNAREQAAIRDLEAQQANQQAIEREADISGFLRGARSLEGRAQDIDAQFGRADRQLEQARVLAPQYESAADLARSDAMLQQDLADRNLARGLTVTEPTTRERFEEGVRSAQEVEALARAGVTGYLDDQATLARELGLDLERERDLTAAREADKDRMLDRELAAGEVALDGPSRGRTTTIAGQEAGAAERMQTEQLESEERRLGDQLDTDEALARIDAKSRTDIQRLINDGSYDEAEMLMGLERDMQSDRLTFEQQNLIKELKNAVTLGQIDMFGAQDLQRIINEGNLGEANTVLEGIKEQSKATVDVAVEQRGAAVDVAKEQRAGAEDIRLIDERIASEQVSSEERVLLEELKTQIQLGTISADAAKAVQRTISQGDFNVALTQLEGTKADATAAVDVAQEQRGAAVDVAKEQRAGAKEIREIDERMASEQISSEERVVLEELRTQIQLGTISADAAEAVQRTISQGNFNVALTQLEGTKADAAAAVDVAEEQRGAAVDVAQEQRGAAVDVAQEQRAGAKEIREIDERIANARIGSEEKVLLEELKTQISLANIDSWTSTSIQNAIIKGDYEEARQQLDYAREIAAGTVTIGGEQVDTIEAGRFNLEEALTDAQLQQLVKSEQGQSIANLMAIVQTLEPESAERRALEATIATTVGESVADKVLKETLLNMLKPIDLGNGEETGSL
jgi:hypothetical protein